MTPKEKRDFMQMYHALKVISKDYENSDNVMTYANRRYGLEPEEALAMAYDNMQQVATIGVKGVRLPKTK